jgi:hypothetical protein
MAAASAGPADGIDDRAAFVERLRRHAGLNISSHIFAGLPHGATLRASLPLTLALAAA